MTDENLARCKIRKVRRQSVIAALDLLRSKLSSKKRMQEGDDEYDHKIKIHCTSSISTTGKKKGSPAFGYSKSLVLPEMRKCLSRQDWEMLQEFFPFLVDNRKDMEPIIWRYAFTMLLYNPSSSHDNVREFLEMCVGCNQIESDAMLKRLLTLREET
ncbi:uncharacterized protein LOC105701900 [Orussus abietinus]|uniref:uncharacterized protein LOC105701900 n=1 Tax=Orussus abietinus TaxID=222816 RepID=UPI0006269F62|nr:uncharacterized protein LOC105701900 [Orussus abietinus]